MGLNAYFQNTSFWLVRFVYNDKRFSKDQGKRPKHSWNLLKFLRSHLSKWKPVRITRPKWFLTCCRSCLSPMKPNEKNYWVRQDHIFWLQMHRWNSKDTWRATIFLFSSTVLTVVTNWSWPQLAKFLREFSNSWILFWLLKNMGKPWKNVWFILIPKWKKFVWSFWIDFYQVKNATRQLFLVIRSKFNVVFCQSALNLKFNLCRRLVIRGSQCLIDKELSVSKQSHKFLKTLSTIRTKNNQLFLFTEPLLSSLKEMAQNSNDSLQLRVLELMVEISNISQEHLEK